MGQPVIGPEGHLVVNLSTCRNTERDHVDTSSCWQ